MLVIITRYYKDYVQARKDMQAGDRLEHVYGLYRLIREVWKEEGE